MPAWISLFVNLTVLFDEGFLSSWLDSVQNAVNCIFFLYVFQVVAVHPQFSKSSNKQFVTGGNKVKYAAF